MNRRRGTTREVVSIHADPGTKTNFIGNADNDYDLKFVQLYYMMITITIIIIYYGCGSYLLIIVGLDFMVVKI